MPRPEGAATAPNAVSAVTGGTETLLPTPPPEPSRVPPRTLSLLPQPTAPQPLQSAPSLHLPAQLPTLYHTTFSRPSPDILRLTSVFLYHRLVMHGGTRARSARLVHVFGLPMLQRMHRRAHLRALRRLLQRRRQALAARLQARPSCTCRASFAWLAAESFGVPLASCRWRWTTAQRGGGEVGGDLKAGGKGCDVPCATRA